MDSLMPICSALTAIGFTIADFRIATKIPKARKSYIVNRKLNHPRFALAFHDFTDEPRVVFLPVEEGGMNFNTASALSAATIATMPMPMLKT